MINVKKLFLIYALAALGTSTILAKESPTSLSKLNKKKIAIKAAKKALKISGYGSEIVCSLLGFVYMQEYTSDNETPTQSLFNEILSEDEWDGALRRVQDLTIHVPFIASIGHGVHGLYKECKLLPKLVWHKIKHAIKNRQHTKA